MGKDPRGDERSSVGKKEWDKRGMKRSGGRKAMEKTMERREREGAKRGAKRMVGAGRTGERAEDIELKWPLGAHSSIPLSLP